MSTSAGRLQLGPHSDLGSSLQCSWEDDEFAHGSAALGILGAWQKASRVEWRQIGRADMEVFPRAPHPAHVQLTSMSRRRKPRSLLPCDGMAAVLQATAAASPALLQSVVEHDASFADGRVYGQLAVGGMARSLGVDSWFPVVVRSSTNIPLGVNTVLGRASRRPPGSWALVFEKMVAKAMGSYAAMAIASPLEIWPVLTGAPAKSLALGAGLAPHAVFAALALMSDAHVPLTAFVKHPTRGLVASSRYTVLRTARITRPGSRKATPLVLLANPDGAASWTGAWSPDWAFWSSRLEDQLARAAHGAAESASESASIESESQLTAGSWNDDGCALWMAIDDFVKVFDSVTASFAAPKWSLTSLATTNQRVLGEDMYAVGALITVRPNIHLAPSETRSVPSGTLWLSLITKSSPADLVVLDLASGEWLEQARSPWGEWSSSRGRTDALYDITGYGQYALLAMTNSASSNPVTLALYTSPAIDAEIELRDVDSFGWHGLVAPTVAAHLAAHAKDGRTLKGNSHNVIVHDVPLPGALGRALVFSNPSRSVAIHGKVSLDMTNYAVAEEPDMLTVVRRGSNVRHVHSFSVHLSPRGGQLRLVLVPLPRVAKRKPAAYKIKASKLEDRKARKKAKVPAAGADFARAAKALIRAKPRRALELSRATPSRKLRRGRRARTGARTLRSSSSSEHDSAAAEIARLRKARKRAKARGPSSRLASALSSSKLRRLAIKHGRKINYAQQGAGNVFRYEWKNNDYFVMVVRNLEDSKALVETLEVKLTNMRIRAVGETPEPSSSAPSQSASSIASPTSWSASESNSDSPSLLALKGPAADQARLRLKIGKRKAKKRRAALKKRAGKVRTRVKRVKREQLHHELSPGDSILIVFERIPSRRGAAKYSLTRQVTIYDVTGSSSASYSG
ncbi:uncharacterized protein AMSG_04374 [Thecamonas trahens ATCC 50062]|uniref:Calpain catalytic domain-containing protein n=1 Tax=Thecamonas trahens ATCC 50062 TaxID=461836 RepID=A0A0L0D7H9_THETB|nr:hypothetical protein AMSG_04374 [Thecamonas trahens ATCC 50062]KNC48145.1 hypothetical protein AMSG_04374 [Thecamonas trahens ATCC 50062]|eukprot:XP_013758715.1 hypothetical protein AMSG_04374 [Thecamonas trahens ATCC 50062]